MIVGIDLGTTNSAIGLWREGGAVLLPNRLGQLLTPSAVSIDDEGAVLVGLAARERQVTHPDRTATAFKRYMGSKRVSRLGKREFLPEELSALVLRSLKEDAEAHLGEPVREAVITVPAYFNNRQREATRRAGELAGLRVSRLLNEPTAAALAYGLLQKPPEAPHLVFDLGGGTFDVSVVELFSGIIEVRASTGDNRLGGEDFNELLAGRFFAAHEAALGRKRDEPKLYERVREQAERARRALSTQPAARMEVVWQEQTLTLEISEAEFEQWCEPLVERLRQPVLRALRDAEMPAAKLDSIILVGGATRMPLVRKAVARMFGRFPSLGPNPDEAIAIGAAVQAGLKSRDAALNDVVMTDVCPYTLGVETVEQNPDGSLRLGLFLPIIERNTVIPVSRVKRLNTVQNNQQIVELKVYQGEARQVTDNIYLGQLEIPVPPLPAGEAQVDCRFTYDINGVLEVDVTTVGTQATRRLTIADPETLLRDDELARRRAVLNALKVHPRDSEANRAALNRANRCFESFLGDRRNMVSALINAFEAELESQDPRRCDAAREQLNQALDRLEGDSYL